MKEVKQGGRKPTIVEGMRVVLGDGSWRKVVSVLDDFVEFNTRKGPRGTFSKEPQKIARRAFWRGVTAYV